MFAEVARRVPGFAGATLDESGSRLVVRLTKPSPEAATQAQVVLTELGRTAEVASLEVVAKPAEYDYLELKHWYDRITMSVLALPGVVLTDIDEADNRLTVAVEDIKYAGTVQQVVAALDVPLRAVQIETRDPIVPQNSLQDYHRPLVGGLQIYIVRNAIEAGICSIGFVAIRVGMLGFVTNSHCTDPQGGVDLDPAGQPTSANPVGRENYDPPMFTTSCPAGRRCRYSDAAHFTTFTTATVLRGWVARSADGSPAWNGQTYYRLTSKGDPLVGSYVEKIGRTTGVTRGVVNLTCATANVSGSDETLLCQAQSSYGSASGDSGGTVVSIESGNDRALRGIHWGSGGVFSPIGNIEYGPTELGAMQLCDPSFPC